jgi:hypothetical protein
MAQSLIIYTVMASALFLIQFQPTFAQFYFDSYDLPEKKSSHGIEDFTNALNGAARLRYGKRSGAESARVSSTSQQLPESLLEYEPRFRAADWIPRFQSLQKRAPAGSIDGIPQFLQSLNGAERLRFG